MSFQPLSWKPAPGMLVKPSKEEEGETSGKSDSKPSTSSSCNSKDSKPSSSNSKDLKPSSSSSSPSSNSNKKLESEHRKKSNTTKPNRKMLSSDSETSPVDRKSARGGDSKRRKVDKEEEEEEEGEEVEEDSDFEPRNTKFRKAPNKSQKRRKSQEDDGKRKKEEDGKKKRKMDAMVEWVEVFVEEEEKWVCVDVVRGKIHCVAEIEAKMPPGSAYITAFNPDLTVKDVTRRYVSRWLSSENKLRCCSEWWAESLRPFRGRKTARDKEEDEEMKNALHLQPLPKTVAEYKNHPLYALQRHLLKFEAIYPPDVSPAGFFKGDPVYPRSSVHQLHSRDTWMKEAKSVRVDEEPYKTVTARPKWDRVTCQVIKDRPLELFGEWQVEDYEPPVASNGKVPRNEYGNVELFKPSMLPRGCVHIPVTGINRLARKLNIDCAAAMVGFDFHSGWTHPVYDGYVVCEEFKDVLMDAWNQEQEEQARKAEEKRLKRVYGNWRKLIKGVLVRERVRQEYRVTSEGEEEEEDEEEGSDKEKKTKKKKKQDNDSADTSNVDDNGSRKKVKQVDIDALERLNKETEDRDEESDPSSSSDRPRAPLITHQVKNLSIDLTSNVVEMAKKSRQRTMKTKNAVRQPRVRKRKEGGQGKDKKGKTGQGEGETDKQGQNQGQSAGAGLSDDSEESDEEEKKEKIRAILNWNHQSHGADPNLSDDSDRGDSDGDGDRKQSQSPTPFLGFSSLPKGRKPTQNARKRKQRNGDSNESRTETESECSSSSSRSTTPEPDVTVSDGPRRLSSRSVKRRVRTYKEEEVGLSEEDISLDESDLEDKSYKPVKD